MANWLFKTEAETFSWDMQKKKGPKGEPWSGVRNWTAAGNMKKMKKGDLGFFYHSSTKVPGVVALCSNTPGCIVTTPFCRG